MTLKRKKRKSSCNQRLLQSKQLRPSPKDSRRKLLVRSKSLMMRMTLMMKRLTRPRSNSSVANSKRTTRVITKHHRLRVKLNLKKSLMIPKRMMRVMQRVPIKDY
jgi:hypothetical protein